MKFQSTLISSESIFYSPSIDMAVLEEVVHLYSGQHDFHAFTSAKYLQQNPDMFTIRDMEVNTKTEYVSSELVKHLCVFFMYI